MTTNSSGDVRPQAEVVAARLQDVGYVFLKMSAAAKHAATGKNDPVIGPIEMKHKNMIEAILKVVNPYTHPLEASIGEHLSSPDTLCVLTAQWKDSP